MYLYVLTAILLFIMQSLSGASSLFFDCQLRERLDIMSGINRKAYGDHSIDAKGKAYGDSDDKVLLQRIIAGFTYHLNEKVVFSFHLYDARAWGWSLDQDDFVKNRGTDDEFVMDPYEEYLELFNGYIQVKDLFFNGLSVKIGRQKIWYGDRRIFGPGGWGNAIGWLWDAVKFSYKKRENFVDVWYGQTREKDPNSFSLLHKHVYQGVGFYSHFVLSGYGFLEPFFAWKNSLFHDIKPEEDTYYFGARFYNNDFYHLNWDITYVSKLGTIGDKTVRAYAYVLKLGYRFEKLFGNPNIVIGRVFASGDSDPSDGVIKTFTKPFGSTCGIHYGRMDIINWSNLIDNQINLYLTPSKQVNFKFAFHNFNLDKAEDKWGFYGYRNKDGFNYKHLGNEYDFQFIWKFSKRIKFSVIYAYFDAGDFVTHNVDNNDAQHIFLQFEYKFSLNLKLK